MLGLAEARQVGVHHRGDGALVAEVDLDLTEVLTLFEQVCGVTVAQRVDVSGLLDAAGLEGDPKGALQCGAAHRMGGGGGMLSTVAFGGKEQRAMAVGFPLLAQQVQRAFRQRHVAVLVALALTDVQEHAFGINVADLQPEAFTQTQAAGVDGREADAVVQQGDTRQHAAHLGRGEDDGQFELGIGADEFYLGRPGPAQGFLPEEFDGAEGLGGGLAGDLLDGFEMNEVLAELLGRDLIGGLGEELTKLPDTGEVGLLGAQTDRQELQVLREGIKDGVGGAFFICMSCIV